MGLISSVMSRHNMRLVAIILMAVALASLSLSCQKSVGAANLISITAPSSDGEGADFYNHSKSLVVKLKPNGTTKANIAYTVDLYEKGELRDSSSVTWSTPDLNVKNAEYVYFRLSSEEFEAYCQSRYPTKEEVAKGGYRFIYEDLQDVFSVKVYRS